MEITPIAFVESPFPTKFGVPRQPGLVRGLVSHLVFSDGARGSWARDAVESLLGREGGGPARLWLVWGFSRNCHRPWSPTVRPPRLGGNARVGVFATRSSFRPNSLAISAVELVGTSDGGRPALLGADMADGTPVYALRPYDAACDSFTHARAGWLGEQEWPELADVEIPARLLARIPQHLRAGAREMLLQDPRPAYTRGTQPGRAFWVPLDHLVIWFRVEDGVALVTDVRELGPREYEELRETGSIG